MPSEGRLVLEGVNVAKRSQKPTAPPCRAASSTSSCPSRLCGLPVVQLALRAGACGELPRQGRGEDPGLQAMWSRAVTTIEAGTLPRLKER